MVWNNSSLRGPRPLEEKKQFIPSVSRQRKENKQFIPSGSRQPKEEKVQTFDFVYPPPKKTLERKPSKTEVELDSPDRIESESSDWDLMLSEEEQSEEEDTTWALDLKEFSSAHREAELSKITFEDTSDSEEESFHSAKQPETKPSLPPIPDSPEEPPLIPLLCFPDGEQEVIEPKKESVYDSVFFTVRCGGCHQPLTGQAITTSGNQWHTRCFKCQTCQQPLEHIAFYEKDSLPYCALDFHEQFSPRCDYCKTPIEEHSISALGKTYHPGHFFCRECGKPFDQHAHFLEHQGHAYCEQDYQRRFGKRCLGCEEIITGEFLLALGSEWHKDCFVCADCGLSFSSTFLSYQGKPYCDQHYPAQKTALKICHQCHQPILGRSSSAFGKDYHPLHFQCTLCQKIMSPRITRLFQETDSGEIICKGCCTSK